MEKRGEESLILLRVAVQKKDRWIYCMGVWVREEEIDIHIERSKQEESSLTKKGLLPKREFKTL